MLARCTTRAMTASSSVVAYVASSVTSIAAPFSRYDSRHPLQGRGAGGVVMRWWCGCSAGLATCPQPLAAADLGQRLLGLPQRHRVVLDHPRAVLARSEEHTSELQSRPHLVCRLLLEKKKAH